MPELDFHRNPYSMEQAEKDRFLTEQIRPLTRYHAAHCQAYANMLAALHFNPDAACHYSEFPFLPVGLFKRMKLSSLDAEQKDYKTVTSSGTSGKRSQIILDARTRTLQQKALAAIGGSFLGSRRLPMLVIDCPSAVVRRNYISARASGIAGFSLFGRHRTFALTDEMKPDFEGIRTFLNQYGSQPFLVFGFTFLVWQTLCLDLEKEGMHPDFSHGILIHGGGWKKLQSMAVSAEEFKRRLKETCGLEHIYNYYGMAEQTGSIFMECEYGHLHCSDYSGILFRRSRDFSLCSCGEKGVIQVLSVLPWSYPGHSLLTEDEGMLLGVDDCPCGRKGAYFKVEGRLKNAELKGCSDTDAASR